MERKTARELLGKLDKDVVAVRLHGKIFDVHTPLTATAEELQLVRATEDDGLRVIRHSAAHVMADAVQRLFPGTKVTIGPAIEDGFYYDFSRAEGTFSEEDLTKIEKEMGRIIKQNGVFRRYSLSRDFAMTVFERMGETFKTEIINGISRDAELSVYAHTTNRALLDTEEKAALASGKSPLAHLLGNDGRPVPNVWFDFCEGPHVPSTGLLGAVKLMSVAGAYWRGDEKNPMLQRIYGTAFASKEDLDAHLKRLEEAKARDHRKLGKELELFFFDDVAPAMPFFLPKGAHVYNQLVTYVRSLYDVQGYDEVITPQGFDPKLFRTSGHLGNYNENMYRLWTEDVLEDAEMSERERFDNDPETGQPFYKTLREESFALKPMNCPSHCVIFGQRKRSYRELPWRMADFGRLHRYERGGVVHGLSRVRTFCQDDAHIFCTPEQVSPEIEQFIKMLYGVYNVFKFEDISIKLALRPEKRIGTEEEWDRAEGALEAGLKAAGLPFEYLPGEGAFYGPKIEFHVKDALKRSWQLGTIQYDPNLPERFELGYIGADGKEHQPIMLHRAILGSLERFFSVYLEHCGGNFPSWIAPKQAIIVTVSDKADPYAAAVHAKLRSLGLKVDVDTSSDKLGAKIRNARLARYPYMLVVGQQEAENGTLGVRSRDRGELGAMAIDDFAKLLAEEIASKA